MENASQKYLSLVAQKISRENLKKWPTPDDVSDYRIAKELGISQSRMSSYRRGRTQFDNEMCLIVGQYLGIPEALVLFELWQDKEQSNDVRKVLKQTAKVIKADFKNKVRALALVPILGILSLCEPVPVPGGAFDAFSPLPAGPGHCSPRPESVGCIGSYNNNTEH